ncbi:MAG: MmgE/PrpD family protein [Peptococcaceae bacterium]|jgi:2-methylcitrate dehydratase PrpD|nr:MmgE/PrpD family protein [Peptococcaceae bacterium]MDH7525582.1 MmgE/PrpD family protein [Peptococcaceae bacterium]
MLFTERLADFVCGTSLDKIKPLVREKARDFFVDCLGCMLAGSQEPAVEIACNYVQTMGGDPVSTIIGRGRKNSPYHAALVNGVSAHVLDYDDVSSSMTGHPSVVVLPAVLAVGEEAGITGGKALEAYIIGVEVACAISRGFNPSHYSRGWHTTSTLGIFGAAAAAGKIIGLNREQMANALGIAASEASGLKINFGTMTKSFHAGRAAAKGLMAALLAGQGFTASPRAFEGEAGFAKVTTEKYDLERIVDTIGSPFEFESPGLSIKPYPSCKGTHNGIDAMLFLAREYDLKPQEVESIECGVQPVANDILIYPRPRTGLEGKFSMNFCVALALLEREVKLEHFVDSKVREPQVREAMEKVAMHVDPEMAKVAYFRGTWDTEVKVKLKNGKTYSKKVVDAKGDPGNPLTEEELFDKYRDCARLALPQEKIEKSVALLKNLPGLPGLSELVDLVASRN